MTYKIGKTGNDEWILCLRCKLRSYNPNDIEAKYCGCCHRFHEDTGFTPPEGYESFVEAQVRTVASGLGISGATCPICNGDGWYASPSWADGDKNLIRITKVPCPRGCPMRDQQEAPIQ